MFAQPKCKKYCYLKHHLIECSVPPFPSAGDQCTKAILRILTLGSKTMPWASMGKQETGFFSCTFSSVVTAGGSNNRTAWGVSSQEAGPNVMELLESVLFSVSSAEIPDSALGKKGCFDSLYVKGMGIIDMNHS